MKAGNFNIYSYLEKLNEEAEMAEKSVAKVDSLGMIIPEENMKTYNWLKSEYQKGKTEVKVEMNIGGSKFEPGYDMQGNVKTTDTFKPGMYGDVKTGDNESSASKKPEVTTDKKPEAPGAPASKKPEVTTDKKPEVTTDKKPETPAADKKPEASVKGKSLNFDLKTKKNDKS